MALSTQADLEKFLQIDVAAEPEPVVTWAIESADAVIAQLTDRLLEEGTYTDEEYDGGNGRQSILFLRQWPVTAIASITEDGEALVEGDDYTWYPDGRVYRHMAAEPQHRIGWSDGRQNILVTYTAGYSAIPNDLRLISTAIAARIFRMGAEWANGVEPGVTRETIGDYRATYVSAREVAPEEVVMPIEQRLLGRYKRRLH